MQATAQAARMQPTTKKAQPVELLTEEKITEIALKNNIVHVINKSSGVKDYPILEFDDNALNKLSSGVRETLKYSKTTPAGGAAYKTVKRLFDIAASSVGLILLSIPLTVVAVMIYKEDGGCPIFSQVRLTEKGKPFRMYKFRSMCMDAEEKFAEVQKANKSDGLAFKADDDPRITKIGRKIRSSSIDELPQLWNVLKGDMSIIGPRPPLPREVVLYTPDHMDRLLVKGGLSCICQTEGRSDMPFEQWVDTDIDYIKRRSFWLDIKLVFKTIDAVLKKKGAK